MNRKLLIPQKISGTWSLIWAKVNWTPDGSGKYATLGFIRKNGKGLGGARTILETKKGLRINWLAPGDSLYQRGTVWKKLENTDSAPVQRLSDDPKTEEQSPKPEKK